MARPAFRGQADADWRVLSGAVRRLVQAHDGSVLFEPLALLKLVEDYHAGLLREYSTIAGSVGGSDIQRLSELQHLGAATGLLDFTENPLVALWFACQPAAAVSAGAGSVFVIDIGDPRVVANGRSLKDPLDTSELGEKVCSYLPDRGLGARVVAQQSVFLIGRPLIPEESMGRVDVPAAAKERVLGHVERMGVTERALFADVPGLAAMNAASVPLPRRTLRGAPSLADGHQAFQVARYEDALRAYRVFAAAHGDAAEGYCLMGDAYAALGRFGEAADAYAKALRRLDAANAKPAAPDGGARPVADAGRPVPGSVHFNLGNALAAQGNHGEAVLAFGQALDRTRTQGADHGRIRYNRANSLFELGKYEDAFEDYEAAMSAVDPGSALLGMGNCKVMLGEFGGAIDCFGRPARDDGAPLDGRMFNLVQARSLQEEVDGREYSRVLDGRNLQLVVEDWQGRPTFVGFSGYKGNVGNAPSTLRRAPGGSGYGGGEEFFVMLTGPR